MLERGRSFEMRPRFVWRVFAIALAVAFGYGAVSDGNWGLLLFFLAAVAWASYLLTARVTLDGSEVWIHRFGRSRRLVNLHRLRTWDRSFGGYIPTHTLSADDVDGGRLSIDRIWWSGWKELEAAVISTGAKRANFKEDLGRHPAAKIVLIAVLAGMVGFGFVLLRLWGDGPMSAALAAGAIGGSLIGLATGAWAVWEYKKSSRETPDNDA